MTDLELIELAVRRTADRAPGPIQWWLRELADEIAAVIKQKELRK